MVGSIVKQDERYTVIDNTELERLVVSSTDLNPGQATGGHFHNGQEEVYFFISGTGELELNQHRYAIGAGSIVTIQDGAYHRVHNTGNTNLYFVCVLEGNRRH